MSGRPSLLTSLTARVLVGAALVMVLAVPAGAAQRGGGRGGGGGGGGGSTLDNSLQTRLDLITTAFTLTKDQRSQAKILLDGAYKDAAPIRAGLTKARLDIATAIQTGKGQADIDAAVKDYADQSTAMASLEMKTLAKLIESLTTEQRANQPAVQTTFFMMRGMFLSDKKWDDVPDNKLY